MGCASGLYYNAMIGGTEWLRETGQRSLDEPRFEGHSIERPADSFGRLIRLSARRHLQVSSLGWLQVAGADVESRAGNKDSCGDRERQRVDALRGYFVTNWRIAIAALICPSQEREGSQSSQNNAPFYPAWTQQYPPLAQIFRNI